MNDSLDAQLKDTVRYLGATLGETIEAELGSEWLQKIEQIRQDGRDSYADETQSTDRLTALFSSLDNQSLLTIGRAFAQFLNLANIAEQEYSLTPGRYVGVKIDIDMDFDYKGRMQEIHTELAQLNTEANSLMEQIQSVKL